MGYLGDVRFPPISDRTADIAGGPFRARKRLMHCTNCELNDSAQVHRTLVPVEEPFTGSKPDIGL
jgi:hypothetical protein